MTTYKKMLITNTSNEKKYTVKKGNQFTYNEVDSQPIDQLFSLFVYANFPTTLSILSTYSDFRCPCILSFKPNCATF